jgi:hypothetical protein
LSSKARPAGHTAGFADPAKARGIGTEFSGFSRIGKNPDLPKVGLLTGRRLRVKVSSGRKFTTGLVPKKTRERAKSGVSLHRENSWWGKKWGKIRYYPKTLTYKKIQPLLSDWIFYK